MDKTFAFAQDLIEQVCRRLGWRDEGDWIIRVAEQVQRTVVTTEQTDAQGAWEDILRKVGSNFAGVNRTTRSELARVLASAKVIERTRSAYVSGPPRPPRLAGPWSVFVSSVVGGLENYRQAAQRAAESIEVAGITCEVMGSTGRSPLEQCLKWARDCDSYLLVLGPTYGKPPPGHSLSVTEMEFQEARESDRAKILAYLIKAGKREREQEEFIQRVSNFDQGYFRTEVRSPEELHTKLRNDLPQNIMERARREP